jgi:hypothetical protein
LIFLEKILKIRVLKKWRDGESDRRKKFYFGYQRNQIALKETGTAGPAEFEERLCLYSPTHHQRPIHGTSILINH